MPLRFRRLKRKFGARCTNRGAACTVIGLFVIPVPADQIFLISRIRSLKIPLAGHARSAFGIVAESVRNYAVVRVRRGRGDLK